MSQKEDLKEGISLACLSWHGRSCRSTSHRFPTLLMTNEILNGHGSKVRDCQLLGFSLSIWLFSPTARRPAMHTRRLPSNSFILKSLCNVIAGRAPNRAFPNTY